MTGEAIHQTPDSIHETVREHYAAAANAVSVEQRHASCCGGGGGSCGGGSDTIGAGLYSALERAELPNAAVLASLGCGNPIAVADLHEGERVLDLGSGGGIDVLLSAKRVGPTGRAFGLDMTDEMLALARRNAVEAGATNVEFLKGQIESIPLPTESVDVVISNCVVNLAADKPAVFREVARVLRPGGRIGITDIVAEDDLTSADRAERGSYCGCVAGALSISEFRSGLREAGLTDISITPTHAVADGMVSAIVKAKKLADTGVKATKPADARQRADSPSSRSLALAPAEIGCCGDTGCC
jgi:arsenite methyltransferase